MNPAYLARIQLAAYVCARKFYINKCFSPPYPRTLNRTPSRTPTMASATINPTSFSCQLRHDLFSGKLEMADLPQIMEINSSGVYVHRDGSRGQELMQCLKSKGQDWMAAKVAVKNLGGTGPGDFTFNVGFILMEHFESRSQFDEHFSCEWQWPDDPKDPAENYVERDGKKESASFEEVLEFFRVRLDCNMNYYKDHANVEQDLGRKVDNREMDSKLLECELRAKAVSTLFDLGDDDDVEGRGRSGGGQVTFSNFQPLWSDGNDTFASARRGRYYFTFHLSWS